MCYFIRKVNSTNQSPFTRVFSSDTHFTAESSEAMWIKCLANGCNILVQSGFESSIQNYAARVILRLPRSSSITTHLKSLNWLPVKVRSTCKIACLCYHCHSSTAPSYVTGMLHRKPLHTRSSAYTMPLFNRPAHCKATLGDRSFSLLVLLSGTLF